MLLSSLTTILAISVSGKTTRQLFRRDEQTLATGSHEHASRFMSLEGYRDSLHFHPPGCRMDRSRKPVLEELVACPHSSMFGIWRPKARLIGPRGWMNDPMGIYQTKNGSYHIGYQCNLDRIIWANISQCSAATDDFVHFVDYNSWKNPITIAPSQLYDIRGVFDGTIIRDGWNGNPSIIYTSVFTGPFGAHSNPPEKEGAETQSIAYTEDNGQSWIKLNFGAIGNPIIYKWPERHLSGFRDPFVFESPEFSRFYSNASINHQLPGNPHAIKPTGKKYLILSGGIRTEADPVNGGPRIFLYRQTEENDIRDWTYLGPLLSFNAQYRQSSEWRGGIGINFECGGLIKINEHGRVTESSSTSGNTELNIFTMGTEGAHNSTYMDDWSIWQAASYDFSASDGNVRANIDFSGVIDWGRAYAFCMFAWGTRQLSVGWVYEDDESHVLTRQRGAQGAFTLFREVFVKVIRNINPSVVQSPEHAPSWSVRSEQDGTQSIITYGQKILPEIMAAFRKSSVVSRLDERALTPLTKSDPLHHQKVTTNVVKFEVQPKDRYYIISAQLDFFRSQGNVAAGLIHGSGMVYGGFRILASEHEWTDVYYDPAQEYLIIDRSNSSVISQYGNSTERAKHRLWPILNPVTNETSVQSLNLTIVVDNSVVEVHANEVTVITTRIYPWYEKSVGAYFFVQGSQSTVDGFHAPGVSSFPDNANTTSGNVTTHSSPNSVHFANVELCDGLLNAWPNRPLDTSLSATYNGHNITGTIYNLWPDF